MRPYSFHPLAEAELIEAASGTRTEVKDWETGFWMKLPAASTTFAAIQRDFQLFAKTCGGSRFDGFPTICSL